MQLSKRFIVVGACALTLSAGCSADSEPGAESPTTTAIPQATVPASVPEPGTSGASSTVTQPSASTEPAAAVVQGAAPAPIETQRGTIKFPWADGSITGAFAAFPALESALWELTISTCMARQGFVYQPDTPATVGPDGSDANQIIYTAMSRAEQIRYSAALAGVDDVYSDGPNKVNPPAGTSCTDLSHDLYPGIQKRAPELVAAATAAVVGTQNECRSQAAQARDAAILRDGVPPTIRCEEVTKPSLEERVAAFQRSFAADIRTTRSQLTDDFEKLRAYVTN